MVKKPILSTHLNDYVKMFILNGAFLDLVLFRKGPQHAYLSSDPWDGVVDALRIFSSSTPSIPRNMQVSLHVTYMMQCYYMNQQIPFNLVQTAENFEISSHPGES